MSYLMGIDGGGSRLRVVIVTPDLQRLAQSEGGTANPGVIGHEVAADHLKQQIQLALKQAGLRAEQITAAGVGIAGASAAHSANWLQSVLRPMLRAAELALSSDVEIALVGAHGKREGILVLAGTGSVVYGVNSAGEAVQVGGWGYVLGDEGSGYWIGLEALKAVARAADGIESETAVTKLVLNHLQLEIPKQIIQWLYHSAIPRNAEIAQLAPLVIQVAQGDAIAARILADGVSYLTAQVNACKIRLNMPDASIAFAGGLLSQPNLYSTALARSLALPKLPDPKYPPVMGAALLAKMRMPHAD